MVQKLYVFTKRKVSKLRGGVVKQNKSAKFSLLVCDSPKHYIIINYDNHDNHGSYRRLKGPWEGVGTIHVNFYGLVLTNPPQKVFKKNKPSLREALKKTRMTM